MWAEDTVHVRKVLQDILTCMCNVSQHQPNFNYSNVLDSDVQQMLSGMGFSSVIS